MIEVLQETTKWEGSVSNGIYHVNASGHLVQYNDKKFSSPMKQFDKRRRSFTKIDEYDDLSQPKTSNVIIVKGSKGNTYTIEDGKCSCPGYTFRGDCKHVKAIA
jgi:hypothetical protein|tara:strand:+ start:2447 stop:2758 length:312 start_codon:yes stop_codon:yes gene_type:complete